MKEEQRQQYSPEDVIPETALRQVRVGNGRGEIEDEQRGGAEARGEAEGQQHRTAQFNRSGEYGAATLGDSNGA